MTVLSVTIGVCLFVVIAGGVCALVAAKRSDETTDKAFEEFINGRDRERK